MGDQILFLLLFIIFVFWSCEDESDNSIPELEPIITFERDIDNVKSSVKQTKDDGYIIAGGKGGFAWLLKTDRYGVEEWQNTYSLGDFGYTRAVIQTSDGGYLYASWGGS